MSPLSTGHVVGLLCPYLEDRTCEWLFDLGQSEGRLGVLGLSQALRDTCCSVVPLPSD